MFHKQSAGPETGFLLLCSYCQAVQQSIKNDDNPQEKLAKFPVIK